jgi:paraquat-inducible protein B
MSRPVSPALVGGFVLGAAVLLVVALYLFGGLGLFRERMRWVTYFEGSVSGLMVGAPVNFRGVQVGTVSEISIDLDPQSLSASIPVYFIVEGDRAHWLGGGSATLPPDVLVDKGLRARLVLQSIVTGQTNIDLDFMPGTPARRVGRDQHVPEIPSVPSDYQELRNLLTKLPLDDLAITLDHTLHSLDRVLSSPDLNRALAGLAGTLDQSQRLMADLATELPPTLAEARTATLELRRTLADLSRLSRTTEGQVAGMGGDLRTTLRSADRALSQAERTLTTADAMLAHGSAASQDLERAMRNLAEASTSLRGFATEIENSPNALLLGVRRER